MDVTAFLNKVNLNPDLLFVSIRTIIIYIFSILLFIYGNRRFRLQTPFDFILPIILGSVLSRGINGVATLSSTLLASFILIALHWTFAFLSARFHQFGRFVKGEPSILVANGEINWAAMKKNQVTKADLEEQLHRELHMGNLDDIEEARLERSGIITFVSKRKSSKQTTK